MGNRRAVTDTQVKYKDINFDPTIVTNPSGAPDLVTWKGSGNFIVVAFDGGGSTEQVQGVRELQHDYKEGTDLSLHVHWAPSTTGVGNVKWQIEYEIIRRDEASPVVSGTLSIVDSADGIAWQETIASVGNIDGTNLKIGDQIALRLFRNPSDIEDTYSNDAVIAFTYGIHYQVDDFGSQKIATK